MILVSLFCYQIKEDNVFYVSKRLKNQKEKARVLKANVFTLLSVSDASD